MAINRDYDQGGGKWSPMLLLSLLMHGIIFSALFWVPGNSRGILSMNEVVYEVNLVDAPKDSLTKGTASVSQKASAPAAADNRQAKRIYNPSRQKDAVTVAKRTVKRRTKPKKTRTDSGKLLDSAISKIERKVKNEKPDHLEKAIAALDKKVGSSDGTAASGSSAGNLAIRLYIMEAETLIKSRWSYPDAIASQKDIEAVVLLKVKKDGTVLETSFIKRSGNTIFDQSVLNAIEKAKPLPPLPEGYDKNYEDIEINFNLRDIE